MIYFDLSLPEYLQSDNMISQISNSILRFSQTSAEGQLPFTSMRQFKKFLFTLLLSEIFSFWFP